LTAKRSTVSDRTLCLSLHIPRMRCVGRGVGDLQESDHGFLESVCMQVFCWFKTAGNAMRSRAVVEPDAHRACYAAEYASHSWRWCTQ
jgi:hypothetical protein